MNQRLDDICSLQNVCCLICQEDRVIEWAHIVPRRLVNDQLGEINLIPLCPTHHAVFDRGLVRPAEWLRIDRDELRKINILLGIGDLMMEKIKANLRKSKNTISDLDPQEVGAQIEQVRRIVFGEPTVTDQDS